MSQVWNGADYPPLVKRNFWAYLRAARRGIPLAVLIAVCLTAMLILRLMERPLFGARRPVTPYITQFVCRSAFFIMGVPYASQGQPMTQRGGCVANHSSWLDIFALNAPQRVYFVSKAEVAGWPGIGWLARATGTVFIRRVRGDAKAQKEVFRTRLSAGHHLLFFPEGTSTDGRVLLPFKPTLFAAYFDEDLPKDLHIQPITVVYRAPEGANDRFYGWWGDMSFEAGLMNVLMQRRHGSVTVVFHDPLAVADYPDRKRLAKACEAAVRSRMPRAG